MPEVIRAQDLSSHVEGTIKPNFSLRDTENLKRTGSIQEIQYNLVSTLEHSEHVAANVRTLDRKTGQFKNVLTGTISKAVLEKKMESHSSNSLKTVYIVPT